MLLVVAYLIGLVMLMTAGIYDGPLAEPSLGIAAFSLATVVFLFLRLWGKPSGPARRGWAALLPLALAVFCIATFSDRRLLEDAPTGQSSVVRFIQLVELGLLASYVPNALFGRWEARSMQHTRFALFAVFLILGGLHVLKVSPVVEVDVFNVQDAAAKALLGGHNPYVDIHVPESKPEGHLIALVYPPTPCYVNAIAYALGKDIRFGVLAALLATGIAMRLLARRAAKEDQPSIVTDAPALLLWLTPKTFFFLEQGWNDIYPLAFAAMALAAHAYERRYLSAVLLGLALSAKQTMIWFVPLALLLGFDFWQWAVFLGTAAATVVPFVMADVVAMKYWMFDGFAKYPPNTKTLSGMSFLSRHFGLPPKGTAGVLLAAAISVLAAWRAPRTRYAFALSATLAVFCFFFFNIWMCINNYYWVAGFAGLAAAANSARSFSHE